MKGKPLYLHRHRAVELKYTMLNRRVYSYLIEQRSGARDRVLDQLRAATQRTFPDVAHMQIAREQGSLMTLLVAALGVRQAIEVGTFTGLSSICIARGLPAKGRLLCLDRSGEWTALAQKYWAKAGVEKKIELRLGPAEESLKKLKKSRQFDFAFIDADKTGYDAYYEAILPRMRRNGLILFDNMLAGGRLVGKPVKHAAARAIDRLNRKLARDRRVEVALLPISDGVTVCRVRGSPW